MNRLIQKRRKELERNNEEERAEIIALSNKNKHNKFP